MQIYLEELLLAKILLYRIPTNLGRKLFRDPRTARQNPPPPRLISASPVVRGERVFRQSLFGPRNALFKHLSWRSEDGSGYETLGSDRQPCELSAL